MHILFVADPLESFQIYKDTTFSMMREAQARGHTVAACEPRELVWRSGGVVQARVRQIRLTGDPTDWFFLESSTVREVCSFDAVVMRKDPPFDSEFFYATHVLEQAEREGAKVFNKPRALRDHPEKLAIMEFPQFIGPTLVTRDALAVRAFHAEHRDIILKPLDATTRQPCSAARGSKGIKRRRQRGSNPACGLSARNLMAGTKVRSARHSKAMVSIRPERTKSSAGSMRSPAKPAPAPTLQMAWDGRAMGHKPM